MSTTSIVLPQDFLFWDLDKEVKIKKKKKKIVETFDLEEEVKSQKNFAAISHW